MKSLIYVSSIFLISIASIFTQTELNVKFKIPNQVIAGQSFVMDLEIDKGDIANFSKLQLNLPEGFSAELLEGRTGTFTFYDQKMKLIWIALPEDPIFNVQVKISVDPSIAGNFNFSGKISYVVGSERKEKQLVSPNFSVEPNSSQTASSSPTADPQTDNSGTTTSTALKTNNQNQKAEVKCVRNFDASKVAPGQTFLVTLRVDKASISGLGKIIDNIPVGFTATEMKNNGAIFSTKGNQVKFLWMTLPSEDSFDVSYKVKVDENITGNKVIDGKMSYLEGDETKTILIDGTSVEITNNPVETNNNEITNQIGNSSEEGTPIESNTTNYKEETENSVDYDDTQNVNNDGSTETQIESQTENSKSTDNTEITQNNSSVNYRVQICATRKEVNTNYFVKNHQINEHIYANMHQGWHKYTVGDFNIYTGARNHRETVKNQNKIKGPFVTAYNNGKRITVQEALMITKDKWVQ